MWACQHCKIFVISDFCPVCSSHVVNGNQFTKQKRINTINTIKEIIKNGKTRNKRHY